MMSCAILNGEKCDSVAKYSCKWDSKVWGFGVLVVVWHNRVNTPNAIFPSSKIPAVHNRGCMLLYCSIIINTIEVLLI